ncbi:MAG: hypothetical protein ACTHMS_10150 [Jatrophihabitans sp.]
MPATTTTPTLTDGPVTPQRPFRAPGDRPSTTQRAKPTAAAPKPTTPAGSGCPSGPDLIIRETDFGLPALAQRLGANVYTASGCKDTVKSLEDTAPSSGCIDVAYARDNPGYNPDADPAPPLKKVFASVGGAC